ncbi:DNA-binding transcriptional regulator, GntR family [Devosia enhydra]|uniref:DNA-binding transcriptional regulator, GntR family n=1 Tax=Devosia enhydra TaxID=665118 RepID=A0A1K2HWY6_9HYPH|nr:GntR family transcriptional regulator [Devosia enhydra]SFZ83299.1 DNA-binding transcriptional regulator, GntR family [Devosia enhydra]
MVERIDGRLDPLQHESAPLRNKIINSLRSAIESGVLKPGTRLVEKDLCEQLNVSRTSLREALRQLQAEGILVNASNRGLTVAKVSRDDAANVYRIRGALEALIVEQFVERANDRQVAELKRNAETLKGEYRSGNADRIVAAKRAFYDLLCKRAGNPIAFDILTKLTLLTSPLRRPSIIRAERQQQSIAEIDAIVDAISRRDKAAARAAAEQHVANSAQSAFRSAEAYLTDGGDGDTGEKPQLAMGV